MSGRRAFWEAVVTVCLPSLVIWTILAYVLRTVMPFTEAWPIYIVCFVLPLPMFFPVYNRYRKGIERSSQKRGPTYHFVCTILMGAFSAANASDAIHRAGWDRGLRMAIAFGWLVASVEHLRRWIKARSTAPTIV
jgi:hypothetical protein